MKKLLLLLFCCLSFLGIKAETTDSEGYPLLYIRGSMTNGFEVDENYKFNRNGNTYSITLESLDGDFKIADDEWIKVNHVYTSTISADGTYPFSRNDEQVNTKATGLKNVTISFTFDKNNPGNTLNVTFKQEGNEGGGNEGGNEGGDTGNYPAKLYIIGNLNDWDTSSSVLADASENGVYTWNNVDLKAAKDDTFSYFTFVTVQGADWGPVNNSDRYGAEAENAEITSNATILQYKVNVNASAAKSWKAAAGKYKIVADLKNKTLTVTKTGESEGGNEGGGNEGGDVTPGKYYVYFENSNNWEQPCVWAWNGSNNCNANGSYPGDKMTRVSGNQWVWYLPEGKVIPANIKLCDFKNQNGNATGDLIFKNGATYKPDGSSTGGDVKPTGTLPVLYINVYKYDSDNKQYILDGNGNKIIENEIIDKDLAHKNYFSGAEYWLDVNGCQWLIDQGAASVGSADAPLPIEIKARGNYTRKGYSKKPYKLKLGSKQNLLNMNVNGAKSKHWAILAHADDKFGYMRNFVGFRLGEMIGLPWTPRQQPIEVVINGDYRGIYFLTESIRVGDGRVPMTELEDNVSDPALISGGYLVELDNYINDCTFSMPDESNSNKAPIPGTSSRYGDLMVTADKPEVLSSLQLRFLREQFTKMNDLVNSSDDEELWKYMDLDDAARYYVVEEIISHYEAYHGSTYLFRDRGEDKKWRFSPLWDCGHAFDGSTEAFFPDYAQYGNNWIGNNSNSGLRGKQKFMNKVKETFQWFINKEVDGSASPYERLLVEIDDYVKHIKDAAAMDAMRWKGVPKPEKVDVEPDYVVDNSDIESDKSNVKQHLDKKINWLKSKWGSNKLDEPARDTTPAAPLPEYAKPGYEPKTYNTLIPQHYNLTLFISS